LHQDGSEFFGWNESQDPDAQCIVKKGERIERKKDFGLVLFEDFEFNY